MCIRVKPCLYSLKHLRLLLQESNVMCMLQEKIKNCVYSTKPVWTNKQLYWIINMLSRSPGRLFPGNHLLVVFSWATCRHFLFHYLHTRKDKTMPVLKDKCRRGKKKWTEHLVKEPLKKIEKWTCISWLLKHRIYTNTNKIFRSNA